MDIHDIENMKLEEALRHLDEHLGKQPDDEPWLVLRAKLRWKLGDRAGAITDCNRALALQPEGPAKAMLQHFNDILDFYNPDLLNP